MSASLASKSRPAARSRRCRPSKSGTSDGRSIAAAGALSRAAGCAESSPLVAVPSSGWPSGVASRTSSLPRTPWAAAAAQVPRSTASLRICALNALSVSILGAWRLRAKKGGAMGKLDHEGEGAELRWAMSMRNAHGRYSLVRRARRTRRWVEPLDRSLICPIGLGQRQRQCCLRNRDRSCCRGGRWGGWRGWRHRTTIEDRNHREFETPRGAFNAERAMKQSVCSTETRFANSGVGGGLPPPQPNVGPFLSPEIDPEGSN